ncbi:MAG: protein kinase [Planctomycetaceae bacterium]
MATMQCPAPDRLLAYSVGKLSEEDAGAITAHLEHCASCSRLMDSLDQEADNLLVGLRSPQAADTYAGEAEFRRALSRVREFPARQGNALDTRIAPNDPLRQLDGVSHVREYEICDLLGEGGMGTVYRAFHSRLKRSVALKILAADRMRNPVAVERFEREMELVGRLDHPNIVRATDAGEFEGTHFLAMEYVAGQDLSRLVRRQGPLPVAVACELIRQAALGLQHAHEHGLVHRDIKPSNLMLTDGGIVKILDLGLARLHSETPVANDLTNPGELMGTVDYMAPEQATDTHNVDIRADLYSLGCTLYQLLAGEAPFSGSQYPSTYLKVKAHAEQPPPPIAARCPDVPEQLVNVLKRLLAKDPADRYATPAELVAALQPFGCAEDLTRFAYAIDQDDSGSAKPVSRRQNAPPISRSMSLTKVPITGAQSDTQVEQERQPASRPPHKVMMSTPALGSFGRTRPLSMAKRSRRRLNAIFTRPVVLLGALAALAIAAAIIIVVKDKSGKTVARFEVPDGQSVTIENAAAADGPIGKQPAGPANQDFDRRAAEWVLSLGGRVEVRLAHGNQTVGPGGNLPIEAFQLQQVNLNDKEVPDAALANLEGLAGLVSLHLYNTPVTDAGLVHLKGMKNLKELNLLRTKITDAGLTYLKSLNGLVFLSLGRTPVTDDGLANLQGLTDLERLDLSHTRVTDACVQRLQSFPKLKDLNLAYTKVTDAGLIRLSGMTSLEGLHLEGTTVTDTGLQQIQGLKNLRSLNLSDTRVTDAGMAHIGGLTNLEQLDLIAIPLMDAGLKHLQNLTKLRILFLQRTQVSDAGLAQLLPRLTDLEVLAMPRATTDAGLAHLKGLTKLYALYLDGSQVTDSGLARIQELLPGLKQIVLSETQVSDAGVERIRGLKQLVRIDVTYTRISSDGFTSLKAAFPQAEILWIDRNQPPATP